jgi:hypothetical protein
MNTAAFNFLNIEPRIMPRGPVDAAVGLVIGVIYFVVQVGVALIAIGAVNALTHNPWAVVLTFLAMFFVVPLFPLLFTVWRLRCDEEGIEFVRALGKPGKIPWTQVESIEPASPDEVVWQAWLRPGFPKREMTLSLTSVGHYRIRWQGGVAYFPPRDARQFLYAIEVGRSCAARKQQAAYSR